MALNNIPPLLKYPLYAGLFSIPTKTTIQILCEHFSGSTVAIVADADIGKYPQEIQLLIRKVRMYFQNNDNPAGIRKMMGKIDEFSYQKALERGAGDSLRHWWIINEYQPSKNLTAIELNYREVMQGTDIEIL